MYIHTIPNRQSRPTILLREGYRENGKTRNKTLANLSALPADVVDGLKLLLKGNVLLNDFEDPEVVESLSHGHVACLLAGAEQIGLDKLIYSRKSKNRSLSLCMILGRLLFPGSKLSLSRNIHLCTLAAELDLEATTDEDDFYNCLDWLFLNQERIEKKLAAKHLENGKLILYDLSSAYLEGSHCPLGKRGYSRDGRPDKLQIVFGLICTKEGCPIAIKVFEGNTSDSTTVKNVVDSLLNQYSLSDVVIAGDRGMLCNKNIKEDFQDKPINWIGALKKAQIASLHRKKELDLASVADNDYKEIISNSFPGERIIICKNPLMASRTRTQRKSIIASVTEKLEKIVEATQRKNNRLTSKTKIAISVGKIIKGKQKWFDLDIKESSFSFKLNQEQIKNEELLDGVFAIRTSLPEDKASAENAIEYYKSLSKVEDSFRCIKTTEIKLRPIFHRLENRVRAHVFICMLAYYLEWHLRKKWKDLIFDDDSPRRESIIMPSRPSPEAKRKCFSKKNNQGITVSSFNDLIINLSCIHKVKLRLPVASKVIIEKITPLNSIQRTAVAALGIEKKFVGSN